MVKQQRLQLKITLHQEDIFNETAEQRTEQLIGEDKIDATTQGIDTGNVDGESATQPQEGVLTTSDTLLCLVLGMDNCSNKPGQNGSLAQTEGEHREEGECCPSIRCL